MKADSYYRKYSLQGPCSCFHRITHMIYVSFTSFTTMNVSLSTESPTVSEKIISIGFVVFALLIITSYTASVAAALVKSDVKLKYSSLEDVARDPLSKVCLYSENSDLMQTVVSGIEILGINGTVFDILKEISDAESNGTVAVLPINHYERAVAQEPHYCDKTQILVNEMIFTNDVAIYLSSELDQLGLDLSVAINSFIDTGEYSVLDMLYLNDFRSVGFDLDEYDATPNGRRQLKGIAGNTGNDIITDASVDLSDGDGICLRSTSSISVLDQRNLLFPFTFTFICTSIGLMIYIVRKCVKRKLHEHRTKKYDLRDKDLPYTAQQFEDEKVSLLISVTKLPPQSIINELLDKQVDEEILSAAVDYLPDTSELIKLLQKSRLSSKANEFSSLLELKTLHLYQIHKRFCASDLTIPSDEFSIEFMIDPKQRLIEDILMNSDAKQVGFMLYNDQSMDMSKLLYGFDTSEKHSEVNDIVA